MYMRSSIGYHHRICTLPSIQSIVVISRHVHHGKYIERVCGYATDVTDGGREAKPMGAPHGQAGVPWGH